MPNDMNTSEQFNTLETAVLKWFINEYKDENLTAQILEAKFLNRNYTGVGVYVVLEVPRTLKPVDLKKIINKTYQNTGEKVEPHWPINGPLLKSKDIEHDGDTILWGEDGYINEIEMYSFGSFFKEDITEFEFSAEKKQIIDGRKK